ncbi:cation diffusion facilitator family transporter [Odoribacter lunatus]|uniref:cation diffusion facilitator family transporter n=1 Tax=Odoribacter lunatus TaxID=2941335 RepID=UPI00203FF55B|nr:cation diffusion facilitator family transporter [Odoribacter lunatus]
MVEEKIKIQVQRRIVGISVLLLIGKFMAFFITNSVSILTDALESIVNVIAGCISLYAIIVASRPCDKTYPFGPGKMELISASIEGLLIVVAGGVIGYEGIRRLFLPMQVVQLDIGIGIVALAGIVNYLLGCYSIRLGKRHDSIALVAGGKHLQSDTYSSAGLVVGLLVLYWTGLHWVDSVLALLFGSIIIYTGIRILQDTIANLTDRADTRALKMILGELIIHRRENWIDVRNMKVLKYGRAFFVDCDLILPWYYDVREGNEVCEGVADVISMKLSPAIRLSIHIDPCSENYCPRCMLVECEKRCHPFVGLAPFTLDRITGSE